MLEIKWCENRCLINMQIVLSLYDMSKDWTFELERVKHWFFMDLPLKIWKKNKSKFIEESGINYNFYRWINQN